MKNAIEVSNLTVAYEETVVLEDVFWQVKEGSLAAVIGPNGGGKSTLLKTLLGLVNKVSGKIEIFGQPPKKARHQAAYLSQAEEVDWDFPINCLDVVMQGRLVLKQWWQRPGKDDREVALESLRLVGAEKLAERPVGNLSGGQRQRVFIARALAQQAKIIFLDEPGTGLDAVAQHQLLDLFYHLQELGHTVVITTHDLNCLATHFDSVLGLNQKVVLSGAPIEVLDGESITKLFAKHFPIIGPDGEVSIHEH